MGLAQKVTGAAVLRTLSFVVHLTLRETRAASRRPVILESCLALLAPLIIVPFASRITALSAAKHSNASIGEIAWRAPHLSRLSNNMEAVFP